MTKGSRKIRYILVDRPLMPSPPPAPPPSSLVAKKNVPVFFLDLQKTFFFVLAKPLPSPPLLVAGPLKKVPFCLRLP